MPARTKARKRALDVLFEADLRAADPLEILADHTARADTPVPEYAVRLVEGVAAHRAEIDRIIEQFAVGWTLQRMPTVDRNILRLAIYELLWVTEVPDAVVLAEAVKLAQDLSTAESAPFVNGVLAAVRANQATVTASPPPGEPPD
ncbi:NusB antitermination factor [Acidothermus cellulolyticus 11B]|jgi:N utilization substance protein B|uniref:Transcription antitermination protein NusB n=1 Tax=Acidothermus cellulolyticus (strain ATCC 43068 / DSM 8971 / 11B) TaxID=351607 RepID=NUSB_ACIC1|nr:transcription antitermination factor NusB [Acidothermus cellulolyticus]A0LUG6.1 RecName: Full=Transcription antitermination protein NusB; AltName: Full=Antitermination factor NusB [Acidothermus cellulolyticus 11B]ABK53076.1 NusB antitermination factor [Acidothermus cellulolyticus 11B]